MFTKIASALAIVGVASALNNQEEFLKEQQKLACYVYTDLEFYNIMDLKKDDGSYSETKDGVTYNWNFCNFDNLCPAVEDKILASATSGGKCTALSGTKMESIESKAVSVDGDLNKSLFLTYTGGAVCASDSSKKSSMEIQLICDKDADVPKTTGLDNTDPCKPVVTMHTKEGCPKFSTTAFISFLTRHPWIMGVILICFGSVVTFLGRKFFQYTLATVGALVGFLGSMLLFSLMGMLNGLESDKSSIALTIVSFLIALGIGVLLGWLLFKTVKVGAMVLGGVAGVFLGITLYQLFLASVNSFWLLLVITILCACAGAFLAFKFYDLIVILSTSLIGAYSLVRGVSVFAGHFPNEMVLFGQLADGVVPKLEWQFYVYLASIIVLFFLGAFVQHKHYKSEDGNYQKM